MRQFTLILVLIVLSLQCGCAVTSARSVEQVSWAAEDAELGRVALLIRIDHHAHERDPERKDSEVREIIREIMADYASVSVADECLIQDALGESTPWRRASEHEVIEAARSANLDTVGLITFDRYGGDVWVLLLPPGWMVNTYVNYSLRLLDVQTGRVIADSTRQRRTAGYLSFVGRKWLPRDLRDDLKDALAAGSAKVN